MDWASDSKTLALVFKEEAKQVCLYSPRNRQLEHLQPKVDEITFLGVRFYIDDTCGVFSPVSIVVQVWQ